MGVLGHFRIQPRLIRILSAQYRSSEDALKELVTNCWDADATEVNIDLPIALAQQPIIIADNGVGMSTDDLQAAFLQVAYDRRVGHSSNTAMGRVVRGRQGIGKFAGFLLADRLVVATVAKETCSRLILDLAELLEAADDVAAVDLPIETDTTREHSGTRIELSKLRSGFEQPSPKRLGAILLREFGAPHDFVINIDGVQLTPAWVEAKQFQIQLEPRGSFGGSSLVESPVEGAGRQAETNQPVRSLAPSAVIWVTANPREVGEPGIVLRVRERAIGQPSFFGLEHDPLVPRLVLRRISGEVRADYLADYVTPSGDAVVENSTVYQELREEVAALIRARVQEILAERAEEETEEGFVRQFEEQLELLPLLERDRARNALTRVFNRLGEESVEKKRVMAELVLNVFAQDPYWVVAKQLDQIAPQDLAKLVDILSEWGLGEVAEIAARARGRLRFLDAFERLVTTPETREFPAIQRVLERNAWLLGDEYELWTANRSMHRIVQDYTAKKYEGTRGRSRPDLILVGLQDRYLLIELKRPSHAVTRTDIAQAEEYRDDLKAHLRNGQFRVLILGGTVERNMPIDDRASVRVSTYDEVLVAARDRLNWLVQNLAEIGLTQEHLQL